MEKFTMEYIFANNEDLNQASKNDLEHCRKAF